MNKPKLPNKNNVRPVPAVAPKTEDLPTKVGVDQPRRSSVNRLDKHRLTDALLATKSLKTFDCIDVYLPEPPNTLYSLLCYKLQGIFACMLRELAGDGSRAVRIGPLRPVRARITD